MLVNSVHTPCVSRCPLDCTHDGNSMLTWNGSNQDPLQYDSLNICLGPISKTRVRIAKSSFYSILIVSALMDFVVTKTQSLRLRATFIIFASVADEDIVKGQKKGNGKFTSVLLAREEIFHRTDVGM